MSLNDDIQSLLAKARTQAPPPVFETLGAMFARLEDDRVGKGAPKPGQPVPDVAFVGPDGVPTRLATLHADRPLVLLFYRGRWCPFCDLTLRAYDTAAPRFAEAGVALVAVSPQTPGETALTGSERNLAYPLFSDPGNVAAHAFGLDWHVREGKERDLYKGFGSHVDRANGDDAWELPAPAAFVIDRGGVVRWAWTDANWTHRPEPDAVLDAVHALC